MNTNISADISNTTYNASFLEALSQRQDYLGLMWAAISTYLIFLMQIGFAFLHVGNIRFRFTQSTLIKKLTNISISCFTWWILGLALSLGENKSGFLGSTLFLDQKYTSQEYAQWMFHFAYAVTCTTIFSGCVAERIQMLPFALFNCVLIGFIYPIAMHWSWGGGWLEDLGYHDFSGSGIIHLIGGTAGLAGGILLGPRKGRFETAAKYRKLEFLPSNMGFIALGTFTLWIGWYGMNCGTASPLIVRITRSSSTLSNLLIIGKVAINSTLAPSICGPIVFLLHYLENRNTNSAFSLKALCNGILAGLVSISASCDNVKPWAAFTIALIAGFIYHFSNKLQNKFQFDDPLNGLSIHMFCGLWGSLMVGWFDENNGIFYGKGGRQFGVQILGCLTNFAWAFSVSFIFLYFFKKNQYIGLRISENEEEEGSDVLHFGGFSLILDMDHLRIGKGEITLRGKKIKLNGNEKNVRLDTNQHRLSSEINEEIFKNLNKSYDIESNDLMEMAGVNKVNKVHSF